MSRPSMPLLPSRPRPPAEKLPFAGLSPLRAVLQRRHAPRQLELDLRPR